MEKQKKKKDPPPKETKKKHPMFICKDGVAVFMMVSVAFPIGSHPTQYALQYRTSWVPNQELHWIWWKIIEEGMGLGATSCEFGVASRRQGRHIRFLAPPWSVLQLTSNDRAINNVASSSYREVNLWRDKHNKNKNSGDSRVYNNDSKEANSIVVILSVTLALLPPYHQFFSLLYEFQAWRVIVIYIIYTRNNVLISVVIITMFRLLCLLTFFRCLNR